MGCSEVPKPSYLPLLWPAEWHMPAPLINLAIFPKYKYKLKKKISEHTQKIMSSLGALTQTCKLYKCTATSESRALKHYSENPEGHMTQWESCLTCPLFWGQKRTQQLWFNLFIFDLMSINFFYNCSSPRHRWPLKWPTIMAQPFDFGIDDSHFC